MSTISYALLLLFLLGLEIPDFAGLATTFDAFVIYLLRPGLKFSRKLALALIGIQSLLSIHFSRLLCNELSEDLRHTSVHLVHGFSASHLFNFPLLLLALAFFIDAALHHR